MIFSPTSIAGAWVVEPEPREDERGYFARVWCEAEFAARGLTTAFVQCNTSLSRHAGTLRGLHYQAAPHDEVKLIQCTRGAVFDVIVDVRPHSASYLQWFGVELSEENMRLLYVPAGCAHGYQTLRDHSQVLYPVSTVYTPAAERGVRWDDPRFSIRWPHAEHRRLSEKDQSWPHFVPVPGVGSGTGERR